MRLIKLQMEHIQKNNDEHIIEKGHFKKTITYSDFFLAMDCP